jgi:hypothetical protein
MKRLRRSFTAEFKLEASRLLDVGETVLRRWAQLGVVAQISQQVMTPPAPSDRYTRGFLTGRPRVFIDGRPGLPSPQSMTVS